MVRREMPSACSSAALAKTTVPVVRTTATMVASKSSANKRGTVVGGWPAATRADAARTGGAGLTDVLEATAVVCGAVEAFALACGAVVAFASGKKIESFFTLSILAQIVCASNPVT